MSEELKGEKDFNSIYLKDILTIYLEKAMSYKKLWIVWLDAKALVLDALALSPRRGTINIHRAPAISGGVI